MTCNQTLVDSGWVCTKPCSCSCKNCLNYKKGTYSIRVKKTTFVIKNGGSVIASGNETDLINKILELGI